MRILTFGVSVPTTEAWPLTRYVCDESSSEEGKTGKVIENDRIFSWVRLLDNECAPPCLVGRASHSFGYGLQVASRIYRTNRRRPSRRGVVVWGFRVSRCGAQNLLSAFLFRPGGRCFEKIRTSCVYYVVRWHRWRLHLQVCSLQVAGPLDGANRQRIPTS